MASQSVINWPRLLAPGGAASALVVRGSSPARAARHCAGVAYLSVPYAGEVALRGEWRMERSVRLSALMSIELARLLRAGCVALCPALQRAELALAATLPIDAPGALDGAVWADVAVRLRNLAVLVVVPNIRGWDRCPGVWADVDWALQHNVPVHVYAERAG